MNKTNENHFKHRLLALRNELAGEITQLSDTILTGAQPLGEHDGCVSESIDKELALEHTEEDLCHAVGDALTRLSEGTFGRCIGCGENIATRRLAALPYTAFCIDCEHQLENERRETKAATETRASVNRPVVHQWKHLPRRKAIRGRRCYLVSRVKSLPA
jgi:RNA polymerase-binding protein DksA